MGKNFSLAEETLGYNTAQDESNSDKRLLVGGSKNVLIDFQKKVKIRSGYTRLGSANTALKNIRNAFTWHTSTGTTLPQRFYDDELEVYLRTIDGVDVNAWTRVRDGWGTTAKLRQAKIFDSTENLDFQVMVNGDDKLYRWNGAVTTISATTSNSITKNGTETWAQARFYANGNKTVIINGTEYAYTGGETTTTLTGVTPDPTGEADNSVVIQKVVTDDNKPEDGRNNHTVHSFQNQLVVGSEDAEEVFISKNTSYTDFTFSSPRIPGEGALLTLNGTTRGLATLGEFLLIGSGRSTIFRANYNELDVGSTLTETLTIKEFNVGVDQGFLNQESIVPVGNELFYLTNETSLRSIADPNNLSGIKPRTLSNPIKPDFDAEDWTDAQMAWFKNSLYISAQAKSRLYMLNWVEDADGKLFRFWNPPQVLPVESMSIIDSGTGNDLSNGDKLHIHSNSVPETYLLFDGASDGQFSGMVVNDKLPIDAKAIFAYDNFGKRSVLKTFDEYYVDGEITPNTEDLILTLDYDFDGATQSIQKTIDGSDEDILEGSVGINSLAQQSLAVNPLGGLLNPPEDARRFRVDFEIAREDFFEIRATFSTNEVDRFWSILSHGSNVELSRRKATNIRK